jgi:hypothetical protein
MDTTTGVLIVGAILALVGGYFLYGRLRTKPEEPYYHFRCPGCGRRLRFRERQVGHRGQCSHCGEGLVFPPVSKSID